MACENGMDQLIKVYYRDLSEGTPTWQEVGCITNATPPNLTRNAEIDDAQCMNFAVDCDGEAASCDDVPPAASKGALQESVFSFQTYLCPEDAAHTPFFETQVKCPKDLEWLLIYPSCMGQYITCGWVKSHTPQGGSKGGGKWQAQLEVSVCGDWSYVPGVDTSQVDTDVPVPV